MGKFPGVQKLGDPWTLKRPAFKHWLSVPATGRGSVLEDSVSPQGSATLPNTHSCPGAPAQKCLGPPFTPTAFSSLKKMHLLHFLYILIFFRERETSISFSFSFLKFLLLFNYSCMPFLPIPPLHPSQTHRPPPPRPSPLILSTCPL